MAKGKRTNAQKLHGDHQEDSQQHQAPGQPPIEDAADHRGHQAGLRRGGFIAADPLHPLNLHAPRIGIVEIFPVGHDVRAERVD